MECHNLTPSPVSRGESTIFITEPWLADISLLEYPLNEETDDKDDNIRMLISKKVGKNLLGYERMEFVIYQLSPLCRHFSACVPDNAALIAPLA